MHNKLANSHLPGKLYATSLPVPVRELHAGYRKQILNHFLLLNDEDRRFRFGIHTSDEVIRHYVEHLNFRRDAVFGNFDSRLSLVGMAHLAYLPKTKGQPQAAEFGVSVLSKDRGQGIGTALLARASVHSRNTHIQTLFVQCLSNNKAMMHLARKTGMLVEYAYGDADAHLKLMPADTGSVVEEVANKQWADFDYVVKENLKRSQNVWGWLLWKPLIRTS